MRRMALFLVSLLLVLTFNAYACVLPLQSAPAVDCSSADEQPLRQACDAFLTLGPQSSGSLPQDLPAFNVDFDASLERPTPLCAVIRTDLPPHSADTPIHIAIPTTVLRI
ncbi:MAG TPA: hypothetical protein VFS39_05565 [Nitrospira sp.]|nr:hypothetical protein [Nitrospira sp.]